ncbi:alpha/beta hydrolase [Streptomyces smyrnaeus]|uniref:Alpha/beta hydrolase n=1 Tax=Streptomyces smyrnaeus TaxID=1387713 RepID=A0ABS3XX51_9ACTN|nr:alpha/beta hydrolase [Streptomyces smyrnaeus]MBO8199979.1 alpha/beta hydrolase [Streptomyces smyrnaeus]
MSIASRVIGTGRHRVIVAHDWFVPTRTWGTFLDCLDGTEFTYALLDARGYGRRRDVAGEYSMEELAGDLISLADQLGWRQFSLVGHSMGAKAAQRAMADAPDRVHRLAAVAPTPAGSAPITAGQWEMFTAAANSPKARRELLDFATGNRAAGAWLDRMVRASVEGSTPTAFAAYARSFVRSDFTDDVTGAPTPVKAITGQYDQAIPTAAIEEAWPRWYPNLQLEELANAGHYPMHETPVALAASIESFLRAGR